MALLLLLLILHKEAISRELWRLLVPLPFQLLLTRFLIYVVYGVLHIYEFINFNYDVFTGWVVFARETHFEKFIRFSFRLPEMQPPSVEFEPAKVCESAMALANCELLRDQILIGWSCPVSSQTRCI